MNTSSDQLFVGCQQEFSALQVKCLWIPALISCSWAASSSSLLSRWNVYEYQLWSAVRGLLAVVLCSPGEMFMNTNSDQLLIGCQQEFSALQVICLWIPALISCSWAASRSSLLFRWAVYEYQFWSAVRDCQQEFSALQVNFLWIPALISCSWAASRSSLLFRWTVYEYQLWTAFLCYEKKIYYLEMNCLWSLALNSIS